MKEEGDAKAQSKPRRRARPGYSRPDQPKDLVEVREDDVWRESRELFGVEGKTALNRLHNLGSFRLDELWDYTKRCSLTNEEILAWFGR